MNQTIVHHEGAAALTAAGHQNRTRPATASRLKVGNDFAGGALPRFHCAFEVALGVDGRVLGFALLASALSGVIFGIIPAWQATKPNFRRASIRL